MKTFYTTIVLFCILFNIHAANAEQRSSGTGKIKFLDAMGTLHSPKDLFKSLFVTENQLSVPGNSEDYSWNEELKDWLHVSNTTYTYNDAGKLTEEIIKDAETNNYLTRTTYSDNPHYIFEEVSYIWVTDQWTPVSGEKSSRTLSGESPFEGYNNGILYQSLENGEWVFQTWIKYILNSYGIPTELQEYHWEGNNWILYSRTGLLTWADWPNRELAAYTKQNRQGNTWVNAERVSKQYDGDNYTITTEIWENQQWVNSTRETYSLTSTEEELILENWTPHGWENTEKYQGTFDDKGNPTGMKYSSWYESIWVVELALFLDLSYNGSDDVTEMVIRSWDPSLITPKNLSKYVFSNFLHIITDTPEITTVNNVKVFPNPAGSSFNIQINDSKAVNYQINIVNSAGQSVFSNSYSTPFISINTEGLSTGMYFLNIKTDDGNVYNRKLLKK